MTTTSAAHDSVISSLDRGTWTAYQKWLVLLTALAIVLDGLDNQLLGFVIPALIAEWGATRADFAPITALSLVAMSVGTAIAGHAGDRIGRRPALIISVAVFGVFTCAIAFVDGIAGLFTLRLIAALGLGGAFPNAAALLAEFTPLRRRSFAVTLGMVCVPVGGLVGSLMAASVLPEYGWRAVFLIGGAGPIALAVLMIFALPESPSILLRDPANDAKLRALLARCGVAGPEDLRAGMNAEDRPKAPFRDLFTPKFVIDTFMLWVAFFACLLSAYTVFIWGPTLLTTAGFDISTANRGVAAFNFGGIAGSLVGAWLMDRFGSRWPMVLMSAGGTALAVLVGAVGLSAGTSVLLLNGTMVLLGAFVAGTQVMLFALATHVYPLHIRSTGVGAALAVGRFGAVLGAYIGASLIGYGIGWFFGFIAVAMAAVAITLSVLRGHTASAARRG